MCEKENNYVKVSCTDLSSVPGLSSWPLDEDAASSRPLEAETRDNSGRSHNQIGVGMEGKKGGEGGRDIKLYRMLLTM